ncbi:putative endolysin [Sinorhizobium phage phiM5]|nr:putative endolysin [Sinorhizobium phage phiM5]
MKTNYEACLAITLKLEGGDVNHPDDPGGKTRWGITQATYDAWRVRKGYSKRSVFKMERYEMLVIYKENYWHAVKGDALPSGVDLATWDYGVNSGPARALKALRAIPSGKSPVDTVKLLCAQRMGFVQGLKTWKTFGKGWSRRIATIEANGVKMAAAVTLPKSSQEIVLKTEADKALDKSKSQSGTAKTSAGGTIGASGAEASLDVDRWVSFGLLGLIVVGVVVAIYFHRKAKHNKERAAAYAAVAQEVK